MKEEWEKVCPKVIVRGQRVKNQFVWSVGMNEKLEFEGKYEMLSMEPPTRRSLKGYRESVASL